MGSWHRLLWGVTPSLFYLQEAFLRMCRWGGLPNFKNEECVCVFFNLVSVQGTASSIILLLWSFSYYGVFVHRGEIVQPEAYLTPASIAPEFLIQFGRGGAWGFVSNMIPGDAAAAGGPDATLWRPLVYKISY